MFDPGPSRLHGEDRHRPASAADLLSLEDPLEDVVQQDRRAQGRGAGDVTVIMLDRPRHEEAIEALREVGASIRFISDGDVAASLFAVMPNTGIDLLWGVGGTPEGVLSASAIKCLGGRILGRLWPRRRGAQSRRRTPGYDLHRVLDTDDLVRRRRRLLRRDGRHRRRSAGRRPLPRRRPRDDRVAGHALALGHRAPRAGDPRPAEAARGWSASALRRAHTSRRGAESPVSSCVDAWSELITAPASIARLIA